MESNTVEVHVHNLRKKLGADAIRTIRGVGYVIAKALMPSIRKTLLAYLLLGLAAVTGLATWFTYQEAREQVGELFDLQLKQLAYSTRIDDLVRGRQPSLSSGDRPSNVGVSEIVTQIWDRDGVLVYWSRPGAGFPVPATEGYSNVEAQRPRMAHLHARRRHACAAGRALRSTSGRRSPTEVALRTLLPLAALIPCSARSSGTSSAWA